MRMTKGARYDGIADWYEREFRTSPLAGVERETVLRLLGEGPGMLLDVGCGTGVHTAEMSRHGWAVTGVDVSEDMLQRARERGLEVLRADAAALPFDDESFDAVVSMWTHTDVDDFDSVVREIARVLRRHGPLVYLGAHPCFVGPHSRFVSAEGVPVLHAGYYWQTVRYTDAPGISSAGLRAKVGATHLPLGLFLQAFLGEGFRIERFEEPKTREFPYMVGLRCRR
jgi:SAM-dependent methyltransferase